MNPAHIMLLVSVVLNVTLIVGLLRQSGTIGDVCAKLSNAESRLEREKAEREYLETSRRLWQELAESNQRQFIRSKSPSADGRVAGTEEAASTPRPEASAATCGRSGKRRATKPRGR